MPKGSAFNPTEYTIDELLEMACVMAKQTVVTWKEGTNGKEPQWTHYHNLELVYDRLAEHFRKRAGKEQRGYVPNKIL